jgi:serine/threonine-protein kinase
MAGVHGTSARARFKREAQATGALSSPHTVELFDFGTTDDGTLYYAMELLEGVDLETLVRRFGPMSPARVLHVLEQTARSLGEAHELGLVHRDIKPANIVLCRVGSELDFVKVLDFGLVKPLYVGDGSPVSIAGAVSGTPGYVAPEHATGRALDGRADLYSLGCVAYFLLTAHRVFDRASKMAMLAAHLTEDPVAPSARSGLPIPEAIDALVLSLLAREPDGRPESARALVARIAAIESALGLRWTDADAEAWWQANMPDAVRPRSALVL